MFSFVLLCSIMIDFCCSSTVIRMPLRVGSKTDKKYFSVDICQRSRRENNKNLARDSGPCDGQWRGGRQYLTIMNESRPECQRSRDLMISPL